MLLLTATTHHAAEDKPSDKRHTGREQRSILDLLLVVEVLNRFDSGIYRVVNLVARMIDRVLGPLFNVIGLALELPLQVIDLLTSVRTVGVYFLTDLIC